MRAVITTVGTSLIANFRPERGTPAPSLEELRDFLGRTRPKMASAETNSLSRLKLDPNTDNIYFLCSATPAGRLCGEALKDHFESQGYYFSAVSCVDGLGPDHKPFAEKGLINLVNVLADIIEKFELNVVINATGGYKAQIAYATLMGLLYHVEVHYIHEDFGGMVRLPLLPIRFDLDVWGACQDLVREVLEAETRKDARALIGRLPEEMKPLFEKSSETDHYVLSPAGQAIARAFDYSLRRREVERIPLKVAKAHSTLWGDHVRYVEDIPDEQVRRLLRRVADLRPLVRKMSLGRMEPHRTDETYLEFRDGKPGTLHFRINTPDGSEYLRVDCREGFEGELRERLGVKVYP